MPSFKNVLDRIMEVGIKEALKSDPTIRTCHGAVVFTASGKVISVGHNIRLNGISTVHAERVALNKIPRGIDRSKLYLLSIRVNNHKETRMAKPCRSCSSFIERSGIGTVIYTVN